MAKEEKEVKEEAKEETPRKEEKENKKDKKKLFDNSKDEKIAELKKAVEEYKDKYYRAIADLDNQRKQYDKEYLTTIKYRSSSLAEKIIPSIEMMGQVLAMKDNMSSEVQAYMVGFDMVYRQMLTNLEDEGIKEISCKVGDEFDHKIHQAMETKDVDSIEEDNKITKIIKKGYMIHDRLIFPTTVVVGKFKDKVEVPDEVFEENKEDQTNNDNNEANA